MKTILIILTVLTTAFYAEAQTQDYLKDSKSLPADLQLKDELQKYKVITDHFNGDIFCNFYNKFRVKGEYTRGLEDNKVKWNNVSVATAMSREAEFQNETPLNYMENFSYRLTDDLLSQEIFKGFGEHSDFAKNLVWDMSAIEQFAWKYWEKLQLNKDFSTPGMNGKLDLAGKGTFENKDIQLTWTGISVRNGERCATIEYRTLNNPLEVSTQGMDMKGRSHYWGTIWVSLEDKQIEHAVLYEDVIMELVLPGQTQKQIMNATREISFEKII